MNIALRCWFSQCYNTRILTVKLSSYYFAYLLIIQLTGYNRTITRYISDDNVVYQWVTGDMTGIIQQLSTTSFEACEQVITENYFSVYTWTENGSFMRNLMSWPMPYWLVLLCEHKVLHCYVTNTVYRCLVAGQLYPSWLLFSRLLMLPSFQPLSGNSLNTLRVPHCFDR